jgi:predicted RNA-binding Zn ribbon-like protein
MYTVLSRYVSSEAPDGLALVQSLLNTRAIGRKAADLLASVDTADEWLRSAMAAWAEKTGRQSSREPQLRESDVAALIALRGEVRELVAGGRSNPSSSEIAVVADENGALRLEPLGVGVGRTASTIWMEVFLAQQNGTWPRLKLCRNEACGSAFYDRSRNSSGVWHDVHTCGNVANLRASRERKRAAI